MATKKATPYDPSQQYRVELAERTEVLGRVLWPGQHLILRGDVLATLAPQSVAQASVQPPIDLTTTG